MVYSRNDLLALALLSAILICDAVCPEKTNATVSVAEVDEIHGYHFHTYFFQTNEENAKEARSFREAIQAQIDSGFLGNCRLNRFNTVPVGPHPIGSYETCCNKTSISKALTWFMENHGNLSVLLHPLTRYEVLDHTERAMFLGKPVPLDVSVLSVDLENNIDMCLPIMNHGEEISNNDVNAECNDAA